MYSHGDYLCEKEQQGKIPTWRDWVFMESKRRYVVAAADIVSWPNQCLFFYRMFSVLFMLDMLYNVNMEKHQTSDCSGQNSVPLPCSKGLWEAKSASAWRAKYSEYLDTRKGDVCLTYGDLKGLRQSQEIADDESKLDIDMGEWCNDLDAFGTLIFNASLMP